MNMSEHHSSSVTSNIRIARIVYYAVWLLVALGAALSEAEVLPTGYLAVTAEGLYAIQMVCVALLLVVPWLSLKWFHFTFVRKALMANPASRGRWNLYRILLMGGFLFFNLGMYYALLSTTTPLFGLLIGLMAYVFCMPKRSE